MTTFRTKGRGRNRKVIPIRQKPYGESTSRALRQIEDLRRKGRKVRLIETNKRLELYAPYRSILDTSSPTCVAFLFALPGCMASFWISLTGNSLASM